MINTVLNLPDSVFKVNDNSKISLFIDKDYAHYLKKDSSDVKYIENWNRNYIGEYDNKNGKFWIYPMNFKKKKWFKIK